MLLPPRMSQVPTESSRHDRGGWSQEACYPAEQLRANGAFGHRPRHSDSLATSPSMWEIEEERSRGRPRAPVVVLQPQKPLREFEPSPIMSPNAKVANFQAEQQPLREAPEDKNIPRVLDLIEPMSTLDAIPESHNLLGDSNDPPKQSQVAFETDSAPEEMSKFNIGPLSPVQFVPNAFKINPDSPDEDLKSSQKHPVFDREWHNVEKVRNVAIGLQSKIHELRRILRARQNAKSVIEDRLFQRVRQKEMGVQSKNETAEQDMETISKLIAELQQARDEFGPLEDDCTQLEDELYAKEFELRRWEADLYSRWTVVPNSSVEQISSVFEESSPEASNVDDADKDMTYHPRVAEFLSKMGDLDLLQERLEDIVDEREQLEDQVESRGRVGRSLGTEEQTWLDNSQSMQDQVEEEIRILEDDLEKLKQECLSDNLIDEDGEPTDLPYQEREAFRRDSDIDSGSQTSEYSKYPILLPNHGVKIEKESEYDPHPGDKSLTISGRINTWLLDRLRSSPLDVGLLARTYEEKGGETSERWQMSVLRLWYEDGTITGAAGFQVYTASVTTQAPRSENSSESTDLFGMRIANQQYRLFIRSSLRQPSDKPDWTEIASDVLLSPASPRGRFSWSSR